MGVLEPNLNMLSGSPKPIANLIKIFGEAFPPYERIGGAGRVTGEMQISDSIRGLINEMSGIAGIETSNSLESLKNNQNLGSWRLYLRHASSIQQQLTREREFKYPSVEEVINKLKVLQETKEKGLWDAIEMKLGAWGFSINLKKYIEKACRWLFKSK